MGKDVREALAKALEKIDRPGTFCAGGKTDVILPGLEVKGMGPVGLPLSAKQAKELIKHCEQAPYGKGEKTLVDTKVRRVWKLDPVGFSLTNPAWNGHINTMVLQVQRELGLENQTLESHLYDLLLYEKGRLLPAAQGRREARQDGRHAGRRSSFLLRGG